MYPNIGKRVKASLVDSLIIITAMSLMTTVYFYIGVETPVIVLLICIVIFFYEPVLVSWKGKTFGHKMFNFQVLDVKTKENISFPKAIVRFVIKSILGIISLLGAFFTNRQQALHDIATNSIIISGDVSKESIKLNGLPKIPFSPVQDGIMPVSIFRKVLVSLVWFVFLVFLTIIIYFSLMPAECLNDNSSSISYCKYGEKILDYFNVGVLFTCIVLGAKGKLFGARSKKQ